MAQKNIIFWVVGVMVLLAIIICMFYFFGNKVKGVDIGSGIPNDSSAADSDAQKFQELYRDTEGNVVIEIKDFVFNPAEITIYPGQGVKWINMEAYTHQVYGKVGTSDEIRSQKLNKGSYYVYTFRQPGTYEYHCTLHPDMKGTVIVK